MSEALPSGWQRVPLGQLITGIEAGKNVRCEERPPGPGERGIVKISAVTWGEFNQAEAKTAPTEMTLDKSARIQTGDLLISRANTLELVGATVIVRADPGNLYLSDKVLRLRTKPEIGRWLNLFLRSAQGRAEIEARATGNQLSMRNIGQAAVRAIEVPLPPSAEQGRVMARVEALLARTRLTREELRRVQSLATKLTEQVRASAFSYALGVKNLEQGEYPRLPDYAPPARFEGLPDLLDGWRWTQLGSIAKVAGGLTKNSQREERGSRMPYLRVANVYADELRLDNILDIGVTNGERERVVLQAGDLLVVEGNGSLDQIGRVAIWDGSIKGCGHQNHLIRVRPYDAVPSRWLLHWLMSPYGRGVLETAASSSSGLHTLSLTKVASIPVPLPCSPEQAETIVAKLDAAMNGVKRADAEVTRAFALLDRLDAAILARAFRGELVTQNPEDEPVAALLARLAPDTTPTPRRPGRRAA